MDVSRHGGEAVAFRSGKFRRGRRLIRTPRLWHNEHGSITIFLSLILAVMLAFVAIFIDYSRMSALKAKSERLLHAATRSVMSAYVPELQRTYGLFAYGDTDPAMILSGVLDRSLAYKARTDVLPILDAKRFSSSVELSRELGGYDVFAAQINEEMKYKAPVNFALEVVGRFKPMSQAMKEASGTVEILAQIQQLYDRREAELDRMLNIQRTAGHQTDGLVEQIGTNGARELADASLGGGVFSAADMAAQYDDYKRQQESAAFGAPPADGSGNEAPDTGWFERMQRQSKIVAYESGSRRLADRMQAAVTRALPPHTNDMRKASEHLLQAQRINAEMEAVIAAAGRRGADGAYDAVTRSDMPGAAGGPAGGGASVRQKLRELPLPDRFFVGMRQRIEGQERDFSSLRTDVEALREMLPRALEYSGMNGYALKGLVRAAGRAAGAYNDRYGGRGSVIREIEAELKSHRADDELRKREERIASGKLREANEKIAFLSRAVGHQADFRRVERFYRENLKLNRGIAAAVSADRPEKDSAAAGKYAMERMDGFFDGMAGMLDATGDRLLQNEYAADHFSHFDYTKVQALTLPGTPFDGAAAGDLLSVENQELEYILYGFGHPGGNLAAAYGEIFAMRLAIRTMESLADPAVLAFGNPLVILAKALVHGITQALVDMTMLAEQGYVELSKTLKIKLTYKDHLRLFLFAHPGSDSRLSRMLAIIRLDTGINPDDHYTYLSADAGITMPVWFLPGVMRTLRIGGGAWEAGAYTVDLQADYSY